MASAVTVASTGNPDVDGMLYGQKWSGSVVTYSFPNSAGAYASGYGNSEPLNSFSQAPVQMQAAVNYAVALATPT